jgi:hypothetical protein
MNNARIVQDLHNLIKSYFNRNYKRLIKNTAKSICAMKNIYQFSEVHFTI